MMPNRKARQLFLRRLAWNVNVLPFTMSWCMRTETGVCGKSRPGELAEAGMGRLNSFWLVVLFFSLVTLLGCQDLVPRDTSSLFIPRFHRSEILGFVAGLGTTFAAVPDLVAMLRRRSSAGMNPRMVAIISIF